MVILEAAACGAIEQYSVTLTSVSIILSTPLISMRAGLIIETH